MSNLEKQNRTQRSLAAISYITAVPAIFVLLFARSDKHANLRFHAWQSLEINVAGFVAINTLPFALSLEPLASQGASYLIALFTACTWTWCAFSVLHDKPAVLPLIGTMTENFVYRQRVPSHSAFFAS